MTLRQISVFIENDKGTLCAITEQLAAAGIDLVAMVVADTQNYGILRIITDNTDGALELLQAHGYIATVTPVLAVDVPNETGGLARVLRILSGADVNVEYVYSFVASANSSRAYVVLRVQDNEKAADALTGQGIRLLSEADMAFL